MVQGAKVIALTGQQSFQVLSSSELNGLAKSVGASPDSPAVYACNGSGASPVGIKYSMIQNDSFVAMLESPLSGSYQVNYMVAFRR